MDKTSIINNAFTLLGVELINSIDDVSINARRAKLIYDQTRRTLLREYPHTSCTKTISLGAPLVNSNKYNLPEDCLRVIKINKDYKLEGRFIYTDEANPNITYIYDNKNEGTYSNGLIEALVYLLAFKLSKSILGTLDTNFYKLYQETINNEKSVDSQQIPTQQFFDDGDFDFKTSTYYGG